MGPRLTNSDWSALHVGVLGLGRSGRGAARLLTARGARVRGFDDRAGDLGDVPAGIDLRQADQIRPPRDLADLDLLVVSPGVDPDHFLMVGGRRAGVTIVGEIELAAHALTGPVVAITGTNGKSTTAALLHHCLAASGRDAVLGGNIGVAASEVALTAPAGATAVLEVSSFQLETIDTFHPRVAVVLNVAPDHLDRYRSFDDYAAAKHNLLRNLTSSDWFITFAGDAHGEAWAATTPARVVWFGDGPLAAGRDGVWVEDHQLVRRWEGTVEPMVSVDALPLLGRHNLRNVGAVLGAATALGVPFRDVVAGLTTFRSLPHRTEPVGQAGGVRYVNDSKATNVHATSASLDGLAGPLVLLLGGSGKGEDYRPLRDRVDGVRLAICYGQEGPRLADALSNACPTEVVDGLRDAFARARAAAAHGDTVLLSPACASFDEFRSFEERGDVFRALVHAEGSAS